MTVNELKEELDKIPVERRDEVIRVYISTGRLSGIVPIQGILGLDNDPLTNILLINARDANN